MIFGRRSLKNDRFRNNKFNFSGQLSITGFANARRAAAAVLILASFLLPAVARASSVLPGSDQSTVNDLLATSVTISESNAYRVALTLATPPLQVGSDGTLSVNGLEAATVEPGAPALPYYSTFIGVPPGATVSVSVQQSAVLRKENIDLLPVPKAQLSAPETENNSLLAADAGTISESALQYEKNESIYALNALYPNSVFSLSEPQYLRDLRLVELRLYPLRYNPQQKAISQATQMDVVVEFAGADLSDLRPVSSYAERQTEAWRANILNFDQARAWRSLPAELTSAQTATALPTGQNTFKIRVDQDGIYEITGAQLAAQNMSLPVDPQTLEMLHDGQTVAFQFIDKNSNNQFDAPDALRFYGWAFDGSRQEQMFVADNIFWLWANGTATNIALNQPNENIADSDVISFPETITVRDYKDNFSAWAIDWTTSPNDPTLWQGDIISAAAGETGSKTFEVDLPDPDPAHTDNEVLVELTTKLSSFVSVLPTYTAGVITNDTTVAGEEMWTGHQNVNVVQAVDGDELKQPGDAGYPSNQVKVELSSTLATKSEAYLTRISVAYRRLLKALNNQLIFEYSVSGEHKFQVAGFTTNDVSKVLVWDISNRLAPEQITMQAQHIQGSGPYTYHIGRNNVPDAQFIATTTDNILAVKGVSRYFSNPLDPPSGSAQWLAITHRTLRDAADDLAAHRSTQMGAWVVNVEEVTNQYGYGFNSPDTIRDYLIHTLNDWTSPPDYVTLFGDATRNPLNQPCPACASWDQNTPTFLVSDFAFVDRWNGMVPSDFSMTLLVGDDLFPDMAIGRLPANSLQAANRMVSKIIKYETQRENAEQAWQKNYLFVADNADAGGDFCLENQHTGDLLPEEANQTHLCLPAASTVETDALRVAMGQQINDVGTSILNYRGHGSVRAWADTSGAPALLSADSDAFWQNVGKSVITLSADCLDGYFVLTDTSALGESFMRLDNRGSAAHWSSSGLGFSSEHSVLHSGFYEGFVDHDLNRIGDAINFAKIKYHQAGRFPSELYSFVLLGDPGMAIVPDEPIRNLLPAIVYSN